MDGLRTEKQEDGYPPEPPRGRGRSTSRKDKVKEKEKEKKGSGKTQAQSQAPDVDRPYSSYSSPTATSSSSTSSTSLPSAPPTPSALPSFLQPLAVYIYAQFSWVPQNTAWSKLKPAIRCALVAWLSVVLFVIPSVEVVLGQASFLILIAVVLSPPSDPFLSVLERELLTLIFVCIAWAWSALALFLANLARHSRDPTASIFLVADGRFIEAVPSVIIGVFIFVGCSALLAFKAKQGPGPFLIPCILACLCINICLTTGALFPFPYYIVGRSILIPLLFHSALSLLASLLVFPSTISAQFTTRITDALTPAVSMLDMHTALLTTPLTSPSFPTSLAAMRGETRKIEASLIPLAAARRLLLNDVIYARFAPGDFVAFQGMLRRLAGRADGLGVFWSLVDPARERFPGTATGVNTPAGTVPGTPRVGLSRVGTRAGSLEREGTGVVEVTMPVPTTPTSPTSPGGRAVPPSPPPPTPLLPMTATTSRRSVRSQPQPQLQPAGMGILASSIPAPASSPGIKHSHSYAHSLLHSAPLASASHGSGLGLGLTHTLTSHSHLSHPHSHSHSHSHSHPHHHHHALLHSSLLSLARARARKPEHAVGTFESQRYLNLEATTLWDPREEEWNERVGGLVAVSCTPLLKSCAKGLSTVKEWLSTVRDSRLKELARSWFSRGKGRKAQDEDDRHREERIEKIREVRMEVENLLDEFRRVTRHMVLEPYKQAFDHHNNDGDLHPETPLMRHESAENGAGVHDPGFGSGSGSSPDGNRGDAEGDYLGDRVESEKEKERERERENDRDHQGSHNTPAHRYLFHCFVYQYNLLQIASIVLEMLDEILRLEEERPKCKLWTPAERVFTWKPWLIGETVEHLSDDDDPDVIQGINRNKNNAENYDASQSRAQSQSRPQGHAYPTPSHSHSHPFHTHAHSLDSMPSRHTGPAFQLDPDADLGLPKRRDPDALPPRNLFESLMGLSYKLLAALGTDGVLFGIKAGLLSVALSLPSLIRASAGFAYDNRFIWGIFMGQLTIARFRGDTIFGISARIISTFFGAIMGMLIWYISCGSGKGNPYGLSAVCAVTFPFFFFARLYWPIPPMRNIVFFVTIILVIGYSYQDEHISVPGAPGVGWPVAWKRFTLVTAGVVAAFVASFFPPSTTIRLYQRRLLATTSSELGTIYCAIISFANTKHEPEIQEIVSSLLAVRNKLTKSAGLRTNVVYEFSLKGRWPADRYQKIADLQVGISYCLSHLMSVLEHLEPAWSRAFLRRTRFMDPGFQGDVLAVISMISSSLRTGNPLPQITPCPLVDRFLLKYHGLDVIHKDAEEDYGLPRSLSIDTLRDEQYLMFSVGISTAFGIINRLDRLMIAVKEIVGEQYHIHGVGFVRAPLPNDHWMNTGGRASSGVVGTGGGGGGGVEMGPRTNTVHFDEPGQFQV